MRDLPAILRVPDLVELLGLTEGGVRAMLRRGELPASRVGRQWIVRRDVFERHLLKGERARSSVREREERAVRLLRALPPPRRGSLLD